MPRNPYWLTRNSHGLKFWKHLQHPTMSLKDPDTEGPVKRQSNDPFPEIKPRSQRPEIDEENEKIHFKRVVCAFRSYREQVEQRIDSNIKMVESLPAMQQTLLQSYRKSLDEQKSCVKHNQTICNMIVKDIENLFDNTSTVNTEHDVSPSAMDIDRVQATLKQFVRDWTTVGESERNGCYQRIIDEIVRHFPADTCNTRETKVLVPGAGLGRLAYEIAVRGYKCQGNEFSLFMLFAASFILNKIPENEVFVIYPWVHQVENNLSSENQTRMIMFPDVNPYTQLRSINNFFSMSAGDFLEVYQDDDYWDCIATCFFIDCAHNICDFILKIFNILKPGGIWVNLGPLLYHFSNVQGEQSIEPSYKDIKNIIEGVGFIFVKEETEVMTRYGHNPYSMLHYTYNSVFFVCKKPVKGAQK